MSNNATKSTELAFELLNETAIISQLAWARFESALPDGLTRAQFGVLNNFVRLGGTRTPAALAEAFQVTRGAMTHTLGLLEDGGWIEIRQDPSDRRSKEVRITASGRRLRKRAVASTAPGLLEIVDAMGRDEIAGALPFLKDIREWLDQNR